MSSQKLLYDVIVPPKASVALPNTTIYNMIRFWGRKPWNIVRRHVEHYTKEGEIKTKELAKMGNAQRCQEFGVKDHRLKLDINFKLNQCSQLWRFPIYTVSLSEEGFERVQQSLVLFPNWKLSLEPQERWEVKILNSFNPLK